jgi:hypothetical protein
MADLRNCAVDILQSTPGLLRSLSKLAESPADKLVPKDVIAHLLLTESLGSMGRIRAIQADDMPTLFGYDEHVELERSGLRGREAHDLLGQLASLRAEHVAWLRTLDRGILERAALHAKVGLVTVEQILFPRRLARQPPPEATARDGPVSLRAFARADAVLLRACCNYRALARSILSTLPAER